MRDLYVRGEGAWFEDKDFGPKNVLFSVGYNIDPHSNEKHLLLCVYRDESICTHEFWLTQQEVLELLQQIEVSCDVFNR